MVANAPIEDFNNYANTSLIKRSPKDKFAKI
jgi:hypothetical protein